MNRQGSTKERPRRRTRATAASPRTKKVIADFPLALFRETDEAASELNLSRSGIIRRAMEELLRKRRRGKLRSEIDDYFDTHAESEQRVMQDFQHVDSDSR
jgi:hypothetical protein